MRDETKTEREERLERADFRRRYCEEALSRNGFIYSGTGRGHRAGPARVTVEHESLDNGPIELPARRDLWNHSPDGFQWGYGGSGPAQLALAILAHHTADDGKATRLHQQFKRRAIATLELGASWTMTGADVQRHLEAIEAEAATQATREGA